MGDELANQIESILSSTFGPMMAKAVVTSQCKRMGISPDEITVSHLDELSEKIKTALTAFSGAAVSDNVAKKILKLKR